MYILGYDAGTSSIKATLMDAESQKIIASATSPKKEMGIIAEKSGWAEQNPQDWWDNLKAATAEILTSTSISPSDIKAIGITYQMHGLVAVDKDRRVLRPSIIWCDSRAVEIGQQAFDELGGSWCLENLLNSPGNFTASKLKWVQQNEPDIYKQIHKVMLPGDYLAMLMTGEIKTTPSGLSEGIMWNFKHSKAAEKLLEYYQIDPALLADQVETFSIQGELSREAASELGLSAGIPIAYRAGDQPNNALSLNVLEPGEIAATAGTSGVVYGIGEAVAYDEKSRVNTFIHVNHKKNAPRYGVLLCINGTGILNSWLKHTVMADGQDYEQMNALAESCPAGANGLMVFPFGNGAERTLENKDIGASVCNLNFNTHTKSHLLRAAQEGIVFAMNYGINVMKSMGIKVQTVRAGHANMFLSPLFASAFATVTGSCVELYNTDGSQGAARGAGLGSGVYQNADQAFSGLKKIQVIEPDSSMQKAYQEIYETWRDKLEHLLK